METQIIINEKVPTGNLKNVVAGIASKDGEHVVYDDKQGRKLLARVSHDSITEWIARDGNGNEVPTVLIRQPSEDATRQPSENASFRARPKFIVRVCACFPDGDRCWWVEVPW
jgi:hypothetical protein